jgi:hypothetical protein
MHDCSAKPQLECSDSDGFWLVFIRPTRPAGAVSRRHPIGSTAGRCSPDNGAAFRGDGNIYKTRKQRVKQKPSDADALKILPEAHNKAAKLTAVLREEAVSASWD